MSQLSIAIGSLLTFLGLASYFGTGQVSVTALIPALFGVPIVLAGLVGLNQAYRKHAMHFAALIALLGLVGSLERPMRKLLSEGALEWSAPLISQVTMAALCAIFLFLAIKSFVGVRLRRRQASP